MDVTVLERQAAALRRIYHDQFAMDPDHHHHHHHQLPWHPSIHQHHHSPQSDWQCDASPSSANPRKRKSEQFEIDDEKSDITTKTEREGSANASSKESLKACEVQKPDYIHVRARRGQATDSHSLAERARREKIGKKMKCLQDLVPGCDKVTGKAGMLDEIINYVQSLQKQVEFLSMKLAAVNPSLDSFFAKEIPAYIAAQLEVRYSQMQQAMDQEVFLDSSCTSIPGWESEIYYNS